jgi:hypothetical protein
MAGKITRARQARPYRRLQSGYPLARLEKGRILDELCAAVTRERGRTGADLLANTECKKSDSKC